MLRLLALLAAVWAAAALARPRTRRAPPVPDHRDPADPTPDRRPDPTPPPAYYIWTRLRPGEPWQLIDSAATEEEAREVLSRHLRARPCREGQSHVVLTAVGGRPDAGREAA